MTTDPSVHIRQSYDWQPASFTEHLLTACSYLPTPVSLCQVSVSRVRPRSDLDHDVLDVDVGRFGRVSLDVPQVTDVAVLGRRWTVLHTWEENKDGNAKDGMPTTYTRTVQTRDATFSQLACSRHFSTYTGITVSKVNTRVYVAPDKFTDILPAYA